MVAQIHALKNKMTTALITAGAMLDGVVPADQAHLRKLMQALVEANTLLSRVPKYDLEPAQKIDALVDVREVIQTVVDDLALVSSATGVALTIAADPAEGGCQAIHGNRHTIYEALEDALGALLATLPAAAAISVSQRADVIALDVRFPDGRPNQLSSLRLPGKSLCGGAR